MGCRSSREGHKEEAAEAERWFLEPRLPGADVCSQGSAGWPAWLQTPWVHPEMGYMEGFHHAMTAEDRPEFPPEGTSLSPSNSDRMGQRERGQGSQEMKQTRRAGCRVQQPLRGDLRHRTRNPWMARSELATRRVLFPKVPLESLKNTHGNMTHCPLPMAPLSWFL